MTMDRRTVLKTTAAAAGALGSSALAGTAWGAGSSAGKFPKGFLWGAATSGYQVEGNNINGDTWLAEYVQPSIYAEKSGDAANSFSLWPQDLDLVKRFGLNTYRFSIEWSRIEPEPGVFSIAMLDHYKAMIDGCRSRGLTPMVSFNHFVTPRWFAARGGWTVADSADLFARFCDRAARHLAGGIGYATTLNEPNLTAVVRVGLPPKQLEQLMPIFKAAAAAQAKASGSAVFISGTSLSIDDLEMVTGNMIAAHKAGRAAIKAVRGELPVGVTLAIPDDQPSGENSIRDKMRAYQNLSWLEAARGDDFLGVQNYERATWDDKGLVKPPATGDVNLVGTPIFPDSLANVVRYAHSVAQVPIIVTEHGVNTADDAVRQRFTLASLAELKKVIDEGVPVKGYVHWSLLDNFEWLYGYRMRYGLVEVDRTTFKRTPKPSAFALGAVARRNAL